MALAPSPVVLSTDEMGRVAAPILNTVGRAGVNAPGDVFVIQALLNDRLPQPHSPVIVSGVLDIGTLLAIEAYQVVVMKMVPPSGRIEPGSATYFSLAARPLVDGLPPSSIGRFGQVPAEVIQGAVASLKRWRVPASVTIAQWAVESTWGGAIPAGSNNPFGLKAVGEQPAVESPTREVVGGQSVTVIGRFRRFDSIAEAFEQHGRLLATAAPYASAMQLVSNPEAFADALTGVYATDPNYGALLKWVIRAYDLTRYDRSG